MTTISQRLNEAEKLKDQGKLDEATSLLTGILSEDESHVLSHMMLARIYIERGRDTGGRSEEPRQHFAFARSDLDKR